MRPFLFITMADKIDLIVTSEAQKGLDELIIKLTQAQELVNEFSVNALNAGKNISKISSPSGFNEFVNSQAKINQGVKEQVTNINVLNANIEKTRLNEIKLQQAREKAFDTYDKNLKKQEQAQAKEAQRLSAAQNLYNKTQRQLNLIVTAYNDLAVRKERYNNLSAKEEQRLITLQKLSEKYNTTLKGVDATVGKHTRNVGNYASGFNVLGNSINQLTREAPAFANSMQTGFMAISNNLPIFFDAISNTQKEIKAMRMEGQQVPGLFKQLTMSFLSWGTALSLGVTLLTLYGPEIVKWATSLFESAKALDTVRVSHDQLQDVMKQGRKNAIEEQQNVKLLLETAKDHNLSYKERTIAVEKLQKQYPFYFENLSKEKILAGQTAEAEKKLNDALISRSKVQAATQKITENTSRMIDIEFEYYKALKDVEKAEKDQQKSADNLVKARYAKGDAAIFVAAADARELKSAKEKEKALANEYNHLKKVNGSLEKYAQANEKAAIGLDYHAEKEKKAVKAKQEHERLNFSIIESEYALQEAILQGQKAEIQARLSNQDLKLDERIKVRKEFTDKSIELLIFQNEKEKALANEKYNEDKEKNELALKNKKISQEESDRNLIDLKKRYVNEIGALEVKLSTDINGIREDDYKYLKDIEEKKIDFIHQNQMLIYKGFEETEKLISENEKLTFAKRQEAFEKQLVWAKKQLELEKEIALSKATSPQEMDLIITKYNQAISALDKIEQPIEKARKATEEWLKSFAPDFLNKSGLGSLNTFFDGTFDKLLEGADTTAEKFGIYFNSIAESAQEAFNLIAGYSQQNFDDEKNRLQAQHDLAIGYAGDSKEAKEKIDNEYKTKQKELQAREAKAKQKQAMFNIAIDTAQAIVGAFAASPATFGLPFSAVAAAVGAIQLAMVASQKIPQYWMGGTHDGGLMMVNDGQGSNYKETIITPDGKIMQPEGRNVVMNAPKGTEIFTHEQWQLKLNDMLLSKGISMPEKQTNNSLNYAQMDEIMNRHLGNKTTQNITFDRNGFGSYISKNGNVTRQAIVRGSGQGIQV